MMVGGSSGLAKRGRKGRLAMSMVIPIHKPAPDAVSRKMCQPSFAEIMNAGIWIFCEKGNWEFIHAAHCSHVLQDGGSFKSDTVENCKRKSYVVGVLVAKKWQQLNERFNQISHVCPICILDVQIKVMFSILNAGHVIQIVKHCSL